MPRDKNEQELQVGDEVVIRGLIESVGEDSVCVRIGEHRNPCFASELVELVQPQPGEKP